MTEPNGRTLALEALRANPIIVVEREVFERLGAGGDATLDDLGMDSLARMELSIWLEVERGISITESEIGELGSFQALAQHLGVLSSGSGGTP
jgi:acyl carrier protein